MQTFDLIYHKVISQLESELPEWLKYHNAGHTKYVMEQAESIAKNEKVNGRDLLLVKIAALYHDTGFFIHREDHEKLGCEIASQDLQGSLLNQEEIKKVCGMISATRVPQKPTTILEMIVADADLEYLGTDKFDELSNNLYLELLHLNPCLSPREWDKIQVEFISKHRYKTAYCKTHKEPVKKRNLEKVKNRLLTYKF